MDPLKSTKAHWREKRDSVEEHMCSPGDWGPSSSSRIRARTKNPHDFCISQPQPLRAALPLPQPALEPRAGQHERRWLCHNATGPAPPAESCQRRFEQPFLPKGFPTGLWKVLERRSTQLSTVPLSKTASSFAFSVEMGQGRSSRGIRRVRNRINLLACSLSHTWAQITVAHADSRYQWYTQTGTKRNYLACLGPEFSRSRDSPVLRKVNATKFNNREEQVLWSDSLLKRQSLRLHWNFITYGIWGYRSMLKYLTLSPCKSIILKNM